MIRLGITGGIGSGKSFVAHRLKDLFQIAVYDTDSEAKRLMCEHEGIRTDLKVLLGENVYHEGKLNKTLLAHYLFASKENAAKINAIVHPRVKEDFRLWSTDKAKKGAKWVAVESAILFESEFDQEVDFIISISASLETRIARVIKRDTTTRKQVLARINAQLSEEERRRRADYIISTEEGDNLDFQLKEMLLHAAQVRKKL